MPLPWLDATLAADVVAGAWTPVATPSLSIEPMPAFMWSWLLGFIASLLGLPLVVACEGLMLRRFDRSLGWRTVWQAAFAMNVASLIAVWLVTGSTYAVATRLGLDAQLNWAPSRGGGWAPAMVGVLGEPAVLAAWYGAAVAGCVVRTVVEAGVLWLFRRDRRGWRSIRDAARMNAVSGVVIAVGTHAIAVGMIRLDQPFGR